METAALEKNEPLLIPRADQAERPTGPSRLWLGILVAIGYLYLAGLFVLLFGGGGIALLALRLPFVALAFFAFGLALARLLRVKDEPPSGIALEELDAPMLAELIERVRLAVGAGRAAVVVDLHPGASVREVGHVLPLRGNRIYLSLGLPLLLALSPTEFEALLAHELAHVSRRHGRWSLWVWNSLERWYRISTSLERSEHWGRRLVRPFFTFYAPRLERRGLAFKRAYEYEADRLAAEVVGVDCYTQMLARVSLLPNLVNRIWEEIGATVALQPDRPSALETLAQELRRRSVDRARRLLAYRLRHELPGTHPTLAQRLAVLGTSEVSLSAAEPPIQSAAEFLLGASYDDVLETATDFWWNRAAGRWQARHSELERARARLTELEASNDGARLYERARLVDLVSGAAAARPLCERLLVEYPNDPFALFVSGKALLEKGDERGLEQLRRAADLEPDAVFAAFQIAFGFLVGEGRFEEAESWRRYAEGYAEIRAAADEERAAVLPSDAVVAHGLSPELVAQVVAVLEPFSPKRAYLARKRLRRLDDQDPQWLLAVELPQAFWWLGRKQAVQGAVREIATALSPLFGFRLQVFTGTRYDGVVSRMSRVSGSLILGRQGMMLRLRQPLRLRAVALTMLAFFALLFVIVKLLNEFVAA